MTYLLILNHMTNGSWWRGNTRGGCNDGLRIITTCNDDKLNHTHTFNLLLILISKNTKKKYVH